MSRGSRPTPLFAEEGAKEFRWDREVADKYGFEVSDVKAARHDLIRFMQLFASDPFQHHFQMKRDLARIEKNIEKYAIQLYKLSKTLPDHKVIELEIDEIIDVIRSRNALLKPLRESLPLPVKDIKRPAIKLLLSHCYHAPLLKHKPRKLKFNITAFNTGVKHLVVEYIE